jgi:hypothetical protein
MTPHEPLWLECYVLELPFDTGVPDNYVLHVKDDVSSPVEIGWDDFDLGAFLGIRPELPMGQMQSTTLWFRRAEIPTPESFQAMITAFPEILEDARQGNPPPVDPPGPPPSRPRTVVAATRIAVPPSGQHGTESLWRGGQITTCMMVLNEYLESIAEACTNPAVGPIVPTEFPPLVFGYRRYLPDAAEAATLPPAEHFAFPLHEYLPWVTKPLTWEQAQIAAVAPTHPRPFALAGSYLRNAERALLQENSRHAIIDACTAIELAVSSAVRVYAPLAGYEQTKVSNIVNGAFASRAKDHFAKLLEYSADPGAAEDALGVWWRDGYLRRNSVVHEGNFAFRQEADEAVTAAKTLLQDMTQRISADSRFTSVPPA